MRRSPVVRSYFICGAPRSGTTLLAGLLASTGLVGRPGEFFSLEAEPDWAAANYARYVAETLARTSQRGVFGAKLLRADFDALLGKLRSVPRWRELPDLPLLEAAFPQPSFVWLSRRDVVAQAVSWLKADQTGEFYVGDARRTGASPRFDYEVIRRLVGELTEADQFWRRWFAANGVEPFAISYEELVADTLGTSRRVLEFLEIEVPPGVRIREETIKQADSVNAEWIARYQAIAEPVDGP